MRLFIAINFDEATRQNILAVQGRLRKLGPGNFSRPENLHLTLAFLGETAPERLSGVLRAMDCTIVRPMSLCFDHVGCFRRDGGDIWWIGLAENAALIELQSALSRNLAVEGFSLERRRFSPHITLARELILPSPPDRKMLLPAPFSASVSRASLMLSERIGGRLIYTEKYSITAD